MTPAHRIGRQLLPSTQLEQRLARIEQALNRRRILKSPGVLPEEGPDGTKLKLDVRPGGGTSESASAQQYKITSISDDYVEGRTWDGTTLGSSLVRIAKPWRLRKTGWDGVTVNYDFNGTAIAIRYAYSPTRPGYRTATRVSSGAVENQAIIAVYSLNDIIYAMEPDGGTLVTVAGVGLTWLDLNIDARAWARY